MPPRKPNCQESKHTLTAEHFKAVVENSPNPYIFLSPDLTILGANPAYLAMTNKRADEIVGRNVFEAFPDDPARSDSEGVDSLRASLLRVIQTRKQDTISLLHYALAQSTPEGTVYEDRYWNAVNIPVLDDNGELSFLYQNPIDVTELVRLRKALEKAEGERESQFRTRGQVFTRTQALEMTNRQLDAELLRLRRLFDHAPGFMAIMRGPEHIFELTNRAYVELFGNRNFLDRSVREAFPEAAGQGYPELLDRVFRTGEPFVGHEIAVMVQNDPDAPPQEMYFDFLLQPLFGDDGKVSGIFLQGHDATAVRQARDELHVTSERLKLALEGSGDGIWDWDIGKGQVVYSPRWKEILGYADNEIGNGFAEWRSRLHPEDVPTTLTALDDCLEGRTASFINEHRLRCKDLTWKWMLVRAVVVDRDASGAARRMAGTMTDISTKRMSDERIWRHANFDTLTDLPNRRLFRDRLDQEVKKAHRTGMQVALLFIDLDRFKEVNDLLGHDAGDMLLMEASSRLAACIRESDTVARLGGDEFTVILTELDSMAHVEDTAQKILATLSRPFRLGNEVAYLSGSVGITLYPTDALQPEELIRNADQAMYAAKSAGRNQFSYFTRSMQERAHTRLRLGGDLRNALGAGQLQVYYQPVVDLATGRVVKAEALLRWHHPGLGAVDPSQFIPLAEESGLIHEIGNWVFTQAAEASRRWSRRLGAPFQIGVNKSPVQFVSQSEDINWADYLQAIGLSGHSIAVEITEGLLLNASPAVAAKLIEYRDAGIQVALDDFGTGYSSMAYLKKFDIDYLKIDQSFVRDMASDEGDRAIAESMIVMAHRLGLKVIAEGIETAEQRDLLTAAGCDFGQGFLFARPAPPDEFERMLMQ